LFSRHSAQPLYNFFHFLSSFYFTHISIAGKENTQKSSTDFLNHASFRRLVFTLPASLPTAPTFPAPETDQSTNPASAQKSELLGPYRSGPTPPWCIGHAGW
jgi:hypothetical protein